MDEIINQEKTDEELNEYGNKVIDLLKPLNKAEKWKVLDSLLSSLTDILKQEGIIITKEKWKQNPQ